MCREELQLQLLTKSISCLSGRLHYFSSCSSWLNFSVVKNSPRVISKPSQSFLMVLIDTSFLDESSMLYTVDAVTPEIFANSLMVIFLSAQTYKPINNQIFNIQNYHLKNIVSIHTMPILPLRQHTFVSSQKGCPKTAF